MPNLIEKSRFCLKCQIFSENIKNKNIFLNRKQQTTKQQNNKTKIQKFSVKMQKTKQKNAKIANL